MNMENILLYYIYAHAWRVLLFTLKPQLSLLFPSCEYTACYSIGPSTSTISRLIGMVERDRPASTHFDREQGIQDLNHYIQRPGNSLRMSTSTHSSGNRNHSPVMSQSRSWPTRLPPLPPRVSRNLVDPRAHPWFAPPPPFATAQPRQPLPPTRAQQHSSPATSYAADENSKRKRPNEDIGDGLRPAKMPNQLPSPTMRCLICLEMLSFRRYPLVSHMHKHYSAVCIDCWQCHIASHVDDTAKGSNIQCAQCNLVLSEAEIKTLATANVYNKYIPSSRERMTKYTNDLQVAGQSSKDILQQRRGIPRVSVWFLQLGLLLHDEERRQHLHLSRVQSPILRSL